MSLIQERKLGDSIARQLYRDPDLLDDPLLQGYVDAIFAAVIAAARERGELDADMAEKFAWKAFIGRDRTVNAFALPGGYFGIHAGMLKASGNRDEFASVVAHEVSHVTQRHISRSIARQAEQSPLILAATILGMIAASRSGSADALAATAYGSQAAAAQLQLNYSRDMEREADRVGFNVLTHAGFAPEGMKQMFERLQQATRLMDSGQYPYLRSHPLNSERIAEAQARIQLQTSAADVPRWSPASPGRAGASMAQDPTISPMMHSLMSARAKVLADNTLDQLRILATEGSDQHLDTYAADQTSKRAAALYTAALAHQRLRDYEAALTTLARLRNLSLTDPAAQTVLNISHNEILRDQAIALGPRADWSHVVSNASKLRDSEQLSRAATMAWAASMLSSSQRQNAARAAERLQLWLSDHPLDSYGWRMLAKAYEADGRVLRSLEAVAQAHRVEGDLRGALDRLQSAQRLARGAAVDHVDASIIDTKVREIQSALREQSVQDRLNRQLAN